MVTLKDIALKAGVNKSTVSRALSGNGKVSEQTRRKIQKIADELGYMPNETAMVLAGKKAKTVGIIVPEIDSNYYARLVSTIETRLRERGYSLIIGQSSFKYENELHYLKVFIQKKVDGIIFSVYNSKRFVESFSKLKNIINIPIVFIEYVVDLPNYDVISIDEQHGVELAVGHLSKCGYNRIGFISENLSSSIRLPAYISALKKFGIALDERIIKVGSERLDEGGYLRMKELLEEDCPPNAVFASYDDLANGAMKAIAERGLRIPEDISIVGFDNIRESEYFRVPLTTVAPPVIDMGEIGVKTLLEKIEKKDYSFVKHISLKPKLVIRNSTMYRKTENEIYG